jgi:hypothetical protein
MPKVGDYKSCTLGRGARSGAPRRTRFHPASILGSLLGTAHLWCHRRGLALVLSESRSLLHRIRRQWKTRMEIRFQEVQASVPDFVDYAFHNERQPYILGIRTLELSRPYLSAGDVELFLQGWFQAERWANRKDTLFHSEIGPSAHSSTADVVCPCNNVVTNCGDTSTAIPFRTAQPQPGRDAQQHPVSRSDA